MKYFNVTGLCLSGRDYMCDISGKVSQIAAMVECGEPQAKWAGHKGKRIFNCMTGV